MWDLRFLRDGHPIGHDAVCGDLTLDPMLRRYQRHLDLPGLGPSGQKRLRTSSVLVVGVGGLGSPAAFYLAAAGVGRLTLADSDTVDLSNLQRQILHTTSSIGELKTASAARTLRAFNPDVTVEELPTRLDASNARTIVARHDFVVEATDETSVKLLVNDACLAEETAFSTAGILRWEGQTLTCVPSRSASLRCLFRDEFDPNLENSCSLQGVLGAVAGILGTIQAAEAVKFLAGTGELLENRMLLVDAWTMTFRTLPVSRHPGWQPGSPHPLGRTDLSDP